MQKQQVPKPAIIQIGNQSTLDERMKLVFLSKTFMETFGPKYKDLVMEDVAKALDALKHHWKALLSANMQFGIVMKFTMENRVNVPTITIGIEKMTHEMDGNIWITYQSDKKPNILETYVSAHSFPNTIFISYDKRRKTADDTDVVEHLLIPLTKGLFLGIPRIVPAEQGLNVTPLYETIKYYQNMISKCYSNLPATQHY